jgi:hypothetical protein
MITLMENKTLPHHLISKRQIEEQKSAVQLLLKPALANLLSQDFLISDKGECTFTVAT